MENSYDDKLERLNLLLQGDEDLENLDTQLSTKMKAKSSARSKQDEELQVSDDNSTPAKESSSKEHEFTYQCLPETWQDREYCGWILWVDNIFTKPQWANAGLQCPQIPEY